jgi:hypothetical protein
MGFYQAPSSLISLALIENSSKRQAYGTKTIGFFTSNLKVKK